MRVTADLLAEHVLDAAPSRAAIARPASSAVTRIYEAHADFVWASLQRMGFLKRNPTKPRAIEVRWDPNSGAVLERRPARFVPLVGDVAAGTDVLAEENVEELLPVPADFTGEGELFMLRVRGDSMIEAGILDGDFVIVELAGINVTRPSPAS